MPSLPESWGLKSRKRADGKAEIVGTDATGSEYVARTCDGPGVTERDLKILDLGNPDKRDADKFIGFYRDERDNARKAWEHSLDSEYMEAATQVVHAGLHLKESRTGYSRAYAAKFDEVFGGN
jgi:hypothetical protein